MFVITSMPVGGAETLLVNMLYRFNPERVKPFVCCLKGKDELGEKIQDDFPIFENLIGGKFDVGVVGRLRSLYKEHKIDAVVTIGAGDKMFWGRLAARYSRVPVILSALHSTGWPDGVGTLNRLLTGITTGFIAVASAHGQHLVKEEGFPKDKVFVIPNGIDTERFQFNPQGRDAWRTKLGIPADSPTVGIVAALRSEKNHLLFVRAAHGVLQTISNAHFVIVGDGPERGAIEALITELGVGNNVHLAGCTHEIPEVLSAADMFALTSDNEASPVSIMEAMSCQRPVVAPDVGSIAESVIEGETGFMVPAGDLEKTIDRWTKILSDQQLTAAMGKAGRDHVVAQSSLDSMTNGYTELVERLFDEKMGAGAGRESSSFDGTSARQQPNSETCPSD